MGYEQETLEKVTKARAAAIAPATRARRRGEGRERAHGTLRRLFAVAENYPDLKANQNVLQLQEELTSTENKIAFARQFYNDSVITFNNKTRCSPPTSSPTCSTSSRGVLRGARGRQAPCRRSTCT